MLTGIDSFLIPHSLEEHDGINHYCMHCDEKITSNDYEVIIPEDDYGRALPEVCFSHTVCVENNKTYY